MERSRDFRLPTEEEKGELAKDPVIRKAIELGGVVAGIRELNSQEKLNTPEESPRKNKLRI